MTTFHTYPDLVHSGDRLAATVWNYRGFRCSAADAVAATLELDADAVILRVADTTGSYVAIGHAPGGLVA